VKIPWKGKKKMTCPEEEIKKTTMKSLLGGTYAGKWYGGE